MLDLQHQQFVLAYESNTNSEPWSMNGANSFFTLVILTSPSLECLENSLQVHSNFWNQWVRNLWEIQYNLKNALKCFVTCTNDHSEITESKNSNSCFCPHFHLWICYWRIRNKMWPAEYNMAKRSRVIYARENLDGQFEFTIFIFKQVYSASDRIELLEIAVCIVSFWINAITMVPFPFLSQKLDGGRRLRPLNYFPKQRFAMCPSRPHLLHF